MAWDTCAAVSNTCPMSLLCQTRARQPKCRVRALQGYTLWVLHLRDKHNLIHSKVRLLSLFGYAFY